MLLQIFRDANRLPHTKRYLQVKLLRFCNKRLKRYSLHVIEFVCIFYNCFFSRLVNKNDFIKKFDDMKNLYKDYKAKQLNVPKKELSSTSTVNYTQYNLHKKRKVKMYP